MIVRDFCILVALSWGASSSANPTFSRLDPLPGNNNSDALAVSDDGIVVGTSSLSTQAVRWVNGIVSSLGDFPGGDVSSFATAISADGTNIAGWASNGTQREAYRWTVGTGMVGLGDLNGGGFRSEAYAISSNGTWIGGFGLVNAGLTACRFSDSFGVEPLGELAGGSYYSQVLGITDDGDLAVGWSQDAEGPQAFRWTSNGGMSPLPGLFAGPYSRAFAVTPDGTVAVGFAGGSGGLDYLGPIVRWIDGGPPILLTDNLTPTGAATSVSADGKLIAGFFGEDSPFYWTPSLGFVELIRDFSHRGVSTGNMRPGIVRGVSPNGEYLVGEGKYQGQDRAWVSRLGADYRAFPTTIELIEGFPGSIFGSRLLQYADNVPCYAFSDETTLRTIVEVTAILPGGPASLQVNTTAYVTRAGLSYSLSAYNLGHGHV